MLATYKENYLYFLVLNVQSVKLHCIYFHLCHIAIAVSRVYSFWQFSLIFSWQKYIIKSKIVLIAGEFVISAKFHGNIKIPWQGENSVARLEIPQPTENCEPLWCDRLNALAVNRVDHPVSLTCMLVAQLVLTLAGSECCRRDELPPQQTSVCVQVFLPSLAATGYSVLEWVWISITSCLAWLCVCVFVLLGGQVMVWSFSWSPVSLVFWQLSPINSLL